MSHPIIIETRAIACNQNEAESTVETKEEGEIKVEEQPIPHLLTPPPASSTQTIALTHRDMNAMHDPHLQFELVMTHAQQTVTQATNEWTNQSMVDSITSPSKSFDFITSISASLEQLDSAYRSNLNQLTQENTILRQQLELQSEEFIRLQLQLESFTLQMKSQQMDELSRIRIEEMIQREKETEQLRRQQEMKESEWLTEKLVAEEDKARVISNLKAQADEVAKKLELLSSNSTALMQGEAEAIATGKGELKRIRIPRSEHFSGSTPEEFHFRLAESQFLRMGGTGYHVTAVEYILNPPLLKRYYDFKEQLKVLGEPVNERLTFHGTSTAAIEAIIKEGFHIGGGAALGHGVYSSESPAYAMGYIKDGRTSLLFSRVTPSNDSVLYRSGGNVIQELVCKHCEQIIPAYIVHYAPGAAP